MQNMYRVNVSSFSDCRKFIHGVILTILIISKKYLLYLKKNKTKIYYRPLVLKICAQDSVMTKLWSLMEGDSLLLSKIVASCLSHSLLYKNYHFDLWCHAWTVKKSKIKIWFIGQIQNVNHHLLSSICSY